MLVTGVRAGLELEGALDLEADVAGEILDVPKGVGFAFEEGDDDGRVDRDRGLRGGQCGEEGNRGGEEGHEEF